MDICVDARRLCERKGHGHARVSGGAPCAPRASTLARGLLLDLDFNGTSPSIYGRLPHASAPYEDIQGHMMCETHTFFTVWERARLRSQGQR